MHVISRKRLREFWEEHADAEKPLRRWYVLASKAHWEDIRDARRTFPHADAVVVASGATMTVFNAGGNKFRIVAAVLYDYGRIYVKEVLTHAQYSKDSWKERL